MALKLSLKPGEQFVVNGAVVTNGDRRTTLIIQNKASILRERDIMTEAQANSPARRIYFAAMLAYMDAECAADYYQGFVECMNDFMAAIAHPQVRLTCAQISIDMMNHDYYRALSACRRLIDYEDSIMGESDVSLSLCADAA